jgi:hypothetical protein
MLALVTPKSGHKVTFARTSGCKSWAPKRRAVFARADARPDGTGVINDSIRKDEERVTDTLTAGTSPDLPSGQTVLFSTLACT